jgi:GcrA cell cycle regulator
MSSWTEQCVERWKGKLAVVGATKPQPGASQAPEALAPTRQPLPAPPQPVIERPALKLDNGNFVTTSTLTNRTCKWPIGDPAELDFHYCGQPSESGGSYCDAHHRKGHQLGARIPAIHWKSPLTRSR